MPSMNDYRRGYLGIVHVGEEHLRAVFPVYHKGRKHLPFFAHKFRPAAIARQRADGQPVYLGVLPQP